jgi:O-antigen/teichoic acid export membrane protein
MDIVPIKYVYLFYLVLIFEHISQELYRVFTALTKTVFANFISFIKTGLWVYVLIFLWYSDYSQLKNLDTVFLLWFASAFLSVMISIFYLAKLELGNVKDYKINRDWILQGLKISIPFFISSLAYKIVEFSNRYFIDFFRDKAEVGIFTFYNGIANLINVIVFTAVIMIYYPKLYDYYINNKSELYKKMVNQFSILVISISFSIAVILVFGIPLLLNIINKSEIYNQYLNVYYLLIIANVILNISLIPHYILYVKKKDKMIMNITIVGAVFNLILNFIFIQIWGLTGVAYSSVISFAIILTLKFYYYQQIKPSKL